MVSLERYGPFAYNQITINEKIPEGVIGNYALGHIEGDAFVVEYVGRSDTDLRERLPHDIGQYTHFKVSIASSSLDAYHKECKNWREFGGETGLLDNKIHPDKPDNVKVAFCPICMRRMLDKLNSGRKK